MSRRRFKRFALVASAGFTLLTVGVGSVVYDWYATRAEWDAKARVDTISAIAAAVAKRDAQIAAWLRADADRCEAEYTRFGLEGNLNVWTRNEWEYLIANKRGVVEAFERGGD